MSMVPVNPSKLRKKIVEGIHSFDKTTIYIYRVHK